MPTPSNGERNSGRIRISKGQVTKKGQEETHYCTIFHHVYRKEYQYMDHISTTCDYMGWKCTLSCYCDPNHKQNGAQLKLP